jgi:hypothetical protein
MAGRLDDRLARSQLKRKHEGRGPIRHEFRDQHLILRRTQKGPGK